MLVFRKFCIRTKCIFPGSNTCKLVRSSLIAFSWLTSKTLRMARMSRYATKLELTKRKIAVQNCIFLVTLLLFKQYCILSFTDIILASNSPLLKDEIKAIK